MKLLGEGGTPKAFVMYGELKSSIISLKMIPVERDITLEPKLHIKHHQDGLYAPFWLEQYSMFSVLVLLLVDGAGHSHAAPILSNDGQMSRPMILRFEVFWLIVTLWMRAVI